MTLSPLIILSCARTSPLGLYQSIDMESLVATLNQPLLKYMEVSYIHVHVHVHVL